MIWLFKFTIFAWIVAEDATIFNCFKAAFFEYKLHKNTDPKEYAFKYYSELRDQEIEWIINE